MGIEKAGKRVVSTISGLAHYYRPRRSTPSFDATRLETVVILPAGFGSFGDQALAFGTQELANREGIELTFLVPGAAKDWKKIGIHNVTSMKGLIDARFGIVSTEGRRFLSSRNVVVIGADTVDGAYGEAFTAVGMAALNDAAKSGRIARLVNFSFSPQASRTSKMFIKGLHNEVEIWARDNMSASRVQELVDQPVRAVPDIGALMRPSLLSAKPNAFSKPMPSLALVPSGHTGRTAMFDQNGLFDYWLELGSMFSKEFSIVVMPHDIRTSPGDPDFCRELSSKIPNSEFWLPQDSAAAKAVIAQCNALVSGRMHACVSSLSSGVPTIGLGYQGKFEGQFAWYPSGGEVLSYVSSLDLVYKSLRKLDPTAPKELLHGGNWLHGLSN